MEHMGPKEAERHLRQPVPYHLLLGAQCCAFCTAHFTCRFEFMELLIRISIGKFLMPKVCPVAAFLFFRLKYICAQPSNSRDLLQERCSHRKGLWQDLGLGVVPWKPQEIDASCSRAYNPWRQLLFSAGCSWPKMLAPMLVPASRLFRS